jgi:D-alanine-D-alanine ligase
MNKYKKVMLIYGGISSEREISIISSEGINDSLIRNNYEVIRIDADEDLESQIKKHNPDVIFNALHGTWGEDGKVQKIIELTNVPYTNSGIRASELAMDKHKSSEIFTKINLNYPNTTLSSLKSIEDENIMNYPYVLKPRNEGSSVGVGIIKNENDKKKYVGQNKERDEILIQEFIEGKEIQVAVYGDNKTGSIEIDPKNEFYDYESKYFDNGQTKHIIPPRITAQQIDFVEKLALEAHNALGCKGISRTDFILEKKSEIFYILEVNTQPGMTPTSLVPEIAKSKGTDFDELINWILNDASTNR